MGDSFHEAGVRFVRCDRVQAEQQLQTAPPGSYLVRPSSHGAHALSLTYKYFDQEGKGKICHLLLQRTERGWTTDGISSHHPNVRSLLTLARRRLRTLLGERLPELARG